MAEWLYEAGIGENRAALVEGGHILEMAIERDDEPGPRVGAILPARLTRKGDASGRGLATLEGGIVAQLTPVPVGLTEGASLLVEIIRVALREGSETKPLRVRAALAGAVPKEGPDLRARIAATDLPVRVLGTGPDLLEEHGWSEALEQAASGIVTTPDVLLRIAVTPAMTLIDVDGTGSAAEVAVAGARAAGDAIRRFGVTGSIGVDLPTMAGKGDRQAAAVALDAILPQPFERTAVNGFGFLQIVRRRERASLMETLQADPVQAAALTLLRRAERGQGHGALSLHAAPAVIARIEARPDWVEALARRVGVTVGLQPDAGLAISAGHASRAQN
ncbi:MAG TPA: ribonuclease [Sphingomonas sp.]|uniref:ribonuclease n=1 Tax=Sphingomonas sp. TaxID=28214 RepID=UPI002CF35F31|nr:ribonuclease [Sphingomonas sp.]HMI20920.1 ribonuclease [Sphingomonas sp.]